MKYIKITYMKELQWYRWLLKLIGCKVEVNYIQEGMNNNNKYIIHNRGFDKFDLIKSFMQTHGGSCEYYIICYYYTHIISILYTVYYIRTSGGIISVTGSLATVMMYYILFINQKRYIHRGRYLFIKSNKNSYTNTYIT